MRVIVSVWLALALTVATVGADTGQASTVPRWLRRILDSLAFDLPPFQFNITTPQVTFNVEHLHCGEFTLEEFSSTPLPPAGVSLMLWGFALSCDGAYSYKGPVFNGDGDMAVRISDSGLHIDTELLANTTNSTNNTIFHVDNNNPDSPIMAASSSLPLISLATLQLPVAANLTFCDAVVHVKQVNFSSLPTLINDAIRVIINTALESQVGPLVCEGFDNLLRHNLTHVLASVSTALAPLLLPPAPPAPEPVFEERLVNWYDNVMLTEVMPWLMDDAGETMNLLMDALLNESGVINFVNPDKNPLFSFPAPALGLNMSIGVFAGSISGLTSTTRSSVLRPVGNYTLELELAFEAVNITLETFVTVVDDEGTEETFLAELTGHLPLVSLRASLLLAVRPAETAFTGVQVGDLFHPIGCLMSSIFQFNVTTMDLNMTQGTSFTVASPTQAHPVYDLISNVFAVYMSPAFAPASFALIRGLLAGPVRTLVNDLAQAALADIPNPACRPSGTPFPSDLVDLTLATPLLSLVSRIVNHYSYAPDGHRVWTIDGLLGVLTRFNSYGRGTVFGEFANFTIDNPNVFLNVDFRHMLMQGLDSVFNAQVLVPKAQFQAANTLGIGDTPRPFTMSTFVNITLDSDLGDGTHYQESGNVSLVLDRAQLSTDATLRIDKGKLRGLQVTELSHLQCILSMINDVSLSGLSADAERIVLELMNGTRHEWIGPSMAVELTFFLEKLINHQAFKGLRAAPYRCKGLPVPQPSPAPSFLDSDFAHYFGAVAVLVVLTACVAGMFWFVFGKETQKVDLAAEELEPSLLRNTKLPRWLRILIPVILVADIGLYLSANMAPGAYVDVWIKGADGSVIFLPAAFIFGLADSIEDMWSAKVYALAVLIAVLSAFWTYCKLFIMLVVWATPPSRRFTLRNRERLLQLLDAMGKWSLIDAYVMLMMMVAFRMRIGSLETGNVQIDVYVEGKYGLYGFNLAAMLSLTMSHVLLYLHRYVVGTHIGSVAGGGNRRALRYHKFGKGRSAPQGAEEPLMSGVSSPRVSLGEDKEPEPSATWWQRNMQWLVLVALLVSMLFIVAGSIAPSFRFTFKGIVAMVLTEDSTEYSIWTLGQAVYHSSANPGAGVIAIQLFLFGFVFITPLVQMFTLGALWTLPLTLKAQYRMFVWTEILSAWSQLDVFISALLATLLEIETFARFLVGDMCDSLNPILDNLFGYDECFGVTATLSSGSWLLLICGITSMLTTGLVMRNCDLAIKERMEDLLPAPAAEYSQLGRDQDVEAVTED